MKSLNKSQLHTLSEFLNMLAVAWFTGGTISPFFIEQTDTIKSIILGVAGMSMSLFFLAAALSILKKVKS